MEFIIADTEQEARRIVLEQGRGFVCGRDGPQQYEYERMISQVGESIRQYPYLVVF